PADHRDPAGRREAPPPVPLPAVRRDGARRPSGGAMTAAANAAYATGHVRASIEAALAAAGVRLDALAPGDLGMLEDFHSLGRIGTMSLVELARIGAADRVLDAGAGIGGTARFVASERRAHVTAIDLTPEYCDVADMLDRALGLDAMIDVR